MRPRPTAHPPLLDEPLASAVEAVRLACRAARAVQQQLAQAGRITKDDRSPVTVADFAVQAIVEIELRRRLGPMPIVGEEHAAELRGEEHAATCRQVIEAVRSCLPAAADDEILDAIDACDHDASGERYWALDPVDGTKGFLRGEQYAIALGLVEAGQVRFGVLGCPNLPADPAAALDRPDDRGVLYAAALGEGAWELPIDDRREPRRITAADGGDAAGPVRICESVEPSHSSQRDVQLIMERLARPAASVRIDSQCKYAVVARGQADAYLRLPTRSGYVEKIWDHAAGSLVATEAGALVSDIHGAPLDFTCGERLERNRGIVCAIPGLHGLLIEAIDELDIGR